MTKTTRIALAACAVGLLPGAALAQEASDASVDAGTQLSLGEKRELANWRENIETNRLLADIRDDYGHPLEVTVDEAMVKPFNEAGLPGYTYCADAISGLYAMMQDEIARAGIKEGVTALRCTAGPGTEEFALEGGTLTFDADPETTANVSDTLQAFLNANL